MAMLNPDLVTIQHYLKKRGTPLVCDFLMTEPADDDQSRTYLFSGLSLHLGTFNPEILPVPVLPLALLPVLTSDQREKCRIFGMNVLTVRAGEVTDYQHFSAKKCSEVLGPVPALDPDYNPFVTAV